MSDEGENREPASRASDFVVDNRPTPWLEPAFIDGAPGYTDPGAAAALTYDQISAMLDRLYSARLSSHGTADDPHVTWPAGHPAHGICGECGAELWPRE